MKSKLLDQFYTNPAIAEQCLKWLQENVDESKRKYFLEPSAGTGSFSNLVSPVFAFDLNPKAPNVKRKDFLTLKKLPSLQSETTVLGNPPFGKNSSLAIKFFNHAAQFGEVIAFIVPRTFKKKSTEGRLNPYFKKVFDKDLPKKSFIFNGEAYDVPCCFQIWVKTQTPRKKEKPLESKVLIFTTKKEADIAVRRVGGRTGKAMENVKDCSESSHYFLKVVKGDKKKVVEELNNLDFSKEANSTAGVRSLSKQEFLKKAIRVLG